MVVAPVRGDKPPAPPPRVQTPPDGAGQSVFSSITPISPTTEESSLGPDGKLLTDRQKVGSIKSEGVKAPLAWGLIAGVLLCVLAVALWFVNHTAAIILGMVILGIAVIWLLLYAYSKRKRANNQRANNSGFNGRRDRRGMDFHPFGGLHRRHNGNDGRGRHNNGRSWFGRRRSANDHGDTNWQGRRRSDTNRSPRDRHSWNPFRSSRRHEDNYDNNGKDSRKQKRWNPFRSHDKRSRDTHTNNGRGNHNESDTRQSTHGRKWWNPFRGSGGDNRRRRDTDNDNGNGGGGGGRRNNNGGYGNDNNRDGPDLRGKKWWNPFGQRKAKHDEQDGPSSDSGRVRNRNRWYKPWAWLPGRGEPTAQDQTARRQRRWWRRNRQDDGTYRKKYDNEYERRQWRWPKAKTQPAENDNQEHEPEPIKVTSERIDKPEPANPHVISPFMALPSGDTQSDNGGKDMSENTTSNQPSQPVAKGVTRARSEHLESEEANRASGVAHMEFATNARRLAWHYANSDDPRLEPLAAIWAAAAARAEEAARDRARGSALHAAAAAISQRS